MGIVLGVLAVAAIFAIAAIVVGREARRLATKAPGRVFEFEDAVAWVCDHVGPEVAADSLHVHGGLGFTWDHDAHLYFRRARSSYHLFGDPRHHRERLARHLNL